MVKVKNWQGVEYEYDKKVEHMPISRIVGEAFSKFCKKNKIVKSRLIEHIYKSILLRETSGSLAASQGYLTINVFDPVVLKKTRGS